MSKSPDSPLIVGLTGGIACGKTTVANYFETQGAHLIDTDLIARQVVRPNAPTTLAIKALLGSAAILADGNLDRAFIKQCIFNDANMLAQYEAIILPAIRQATLAALRQVPADACYAILIVPLLFEKGLDKHCHVTVSVDVPEAEQIRRAIKRKPGDEAVIRQIIATQMPRDERNARADYIVDNNVPLEKLYAQLDVLHEKLTALKQ